VSSSVPAALTQRHQQVGDVGFAQVLPLQAVPPIGIHGSTVDLVDDQSARAIEYSSDEVPLTATWATAP
jgi:hypothetical protein